jgi:hypothetical protein
MRVENALDDVAGNIRQALRYGVCLTPSLKWSAAISLHAGPSGGKQSRIGTFSTLDDAARAYDAEIRRRGWAWAKPLNFPQPGETEEYLRAGERLLVDERGLSFSLAAAPELPGSLGVGLGRNRSKWSSTRIPTRPLLSLTSALYVRYVGRFGWS